MKRSSAAPFLAAALLLWACGSDGEIVDAPPRFATPAELRGSWQPIPWRLDPAMRQRVADLCRRDIELVPGSVPAVMDARGAGVVTVRMTGAGAGSCDALEIEADGGVTGAGGGWGQVGPERLAEPDHGRLDQVQRGQIGGGALTVEGWSVYGRAGTGIAVVQVEPVGGPIATATLENGWFSAWWPADIPDEQLGADPFPRVVIRAFDATGAVLYETTSE